MTVAADITDVVPSETIERFIEAANLAPPTALAMAWTGVVGKGSGNNVVLPRFDNITVPAGTKAENDEFSLVASTTSSSNVAGGWVGYADRVSWESDNQSVINAVEAVVQNGVAHLRDRVDADGLSQLAGFTTDADFSGTGLTDERVLTALATFVGQHPNKTAAGRGAVLNIAQMRDYAQDLRANGGSQLGGDAESERVAALMGFREGFVGVRHRTQFFSSDNVQVSVGEADGALMQLGQFGPLAYRNWAPIDWEADWEPRRKAWMVVIAANYGWTLANQNNGIGLISTGT